MAAPPEVTITYMDGKWRLDKRQSDSFDEILSLQGVGWITRKAINYATITLHVKQLKLESGDTVITTQPHLTGGISRGLERDTLDWNEQFKEDPIFGPVHTKHRYVVFSEIAPDEGQEDAEFLNAEWDVGKDGQLMQHLSWNDKAGWKAVEIWGFEAIDGKRYHVRRIVFKKGDTIKKVRLIHEYLGPLD